MWLLLPSILVCLFFGTVNPQPRTQSATILQTSPSLANEILQRLNFFKYRPSGGAFNAPNGAYGQNNWNGGRNGNNNNRRNGRNGGNGRRNSNNEREEAPKVPDYKGAIFSGGGYSAPLLTTRSSEDAYNSNGGDYGGGGNNNGGGYGGGNNNNGGGNRGRNNNNGGDEGEESDPREYKGATYSGGGYSQSLALLGINPDKGPNNGNGDGYENGNGNGESSGSQFTGYGGNGGYTGDGGDGGGSDYGAGAYGGDGR